MIRKFRKDDLNTVMKIWLDTNINAHDFVPKKYWLDNYEMVRDMLPQAEIYVYEDDITHMIQGFIGLSEQYIEGIFVREEFQSGGIGKQLLNYVKQMKSSLSLSVYQKNTRAVSFYQREDFVVKSENKDYDTNEKEFIMSWSNMIYS